MLDQKNQERCLLCLEKWGKGPQLVILLEECSELSKEVCKALRGNQRTEKLEEELVDVLVMAEQLRLMLNLSEDEINRMAAQKLQRALKRM